MEIISNIRLVSNTYEVEIDLAQGGLTPVEAEAIRQFGEPVTETGGEFDNGSGLEFELPEADRKFPSQFPVKAVFSLADNANANARAILFKDTIIQRLTTSVIDIRELSAGITGREIINIDTTPN